MSGVMFLIRAFFATAGVFFLLNACSLSGIEDSSGAKRAQEWSLRSKALEAQLGFSVDLGPTRFFEDRRSLLNQGVPDQQELTLYQRDEATVPSFEPIVLQKSKPVCQTRVETTRRDTEAREISIQKRFRGEGCEHLAEEYEAKFEGDFIRRSFVENTYRDTVYPESPEEEPVVELREDDRGYSYSYSYWPLGEDPSGNRRERVLSFPLNGTDSSIFSTEYTYDDASRLESEETLTTVAGDTLVSKSIARYSYDAAGRIERAETSVFRRSQGEGFSAEPERVHVDSGSYEDTTGNGEVDRVRLVYDDGGRNERVDTYWFDGERLKTYELEFHSFKLRNEYTYDSLGRLETGTSQLLRGEGLVSGQGNFTISYTSNKVVAAIDYDIDGATNLIAEVTFDESGRIIERRKRWQGRDDRRPSDNDGNPIQEHLAKYAYAGDEVRVTIFHVLGEPADTDEEVY